MVFGRRDRCIGRALKRIGRNKKGTLDRLVTEFWPSIPGHRRKRRSLSNARSRIPSWNRVLSRHHHWNYLHRRPAFRIFLAFLKKYIYSTVADKRCLWKTKISIPSCTIILHHTLHSSLVHLSLGYFFCQADIFPLYKTRSFVTSFESEYEK